GARPPPPSPPVPYTTLFRSKETRQLTPVGCEAAGYFEAFSQKAILLRWPLRRAAWQSPLPTIPVPSGWHRYAAPARGWDPCAGRSEEHTSELQSRENLVCRL